MRKILKLLTSKLVIVAPLVLLQFGLLVMMIYNISLAYEILPVLNMLGIATCVRVINRFEDPSYKIAWVFLLLSVPIVGVPLYFIAGNKRIPKSLMNGTIKTNHSMDNLLVISEKDDDMMFHYGSESLGFPVYKNTSSYYFSSGEKWFKDYLSHLRKARHFIFMEYFIFDEGKCLDELIEVLRQKIAEGVEVKLIYDDFGCLTMSRKAWRRMEEIGVEVYCFNKITPRLLVTMNNRDHRKITVIDNRFAYTGGINMADEYVNRIKRFGKWKDSAIRIEGDAVWSFTVMFLGMLEYCRKGSEFLDYRQYRDRHEFVSDGGAYQPYSDSPTDGEQTSLSYQLNMVKVARKYIYIDTPYLIPNEEMLDALMLAAKNGIDVRILVPAVPDKFFVNQITKGNYERLIGAGVRVYEYTPGFDHAKNFVCDDKYAIVGSANMDYRSYFLHFEAGILMRDTPSIPYVKKDFLESIELSREITQQDIADTLLAVKVMRGILNLFVPFV